VGTRDPERNSLGFNEDVLELEAGRVGQQRHGELRCGFHALICSSCAYFAAPKATESRIVEAAKAHAEATKGGDPATRFVEILASLFEGGRVYVKHKDTGKHPSGCVRLGWDETEESYEPKRGADFIGWAGDVHLYLDKDAVYAAVVSFANRGGISFGIKQRALWDSLKRSGMSLTNDGRADTTARIEKKPQRVIQVAKETILGRADAL